MKYMFKTMIIISALAFSSIASAALVEQETLVIDFSTGDSGTGGTIDVVYDFDTPLSAVGTDILIGNLTVEGANLANGTHTVDAYLNFDTAANTITIEGSILSLGIESQVLLEGSFLDENGWGVSDMLGGGVAFTGTGFDTKSSDLLTALGAPIDTEFAFFGFSLESVNNNVISTDIINTAVGGDRDIPQVPVPAAVWLFGSGLLGMVGVARRKV